MSRDPGHHKTGDHVRKMRNENVPCPQFVSGPGGERVVELSVFPGSGARDSEHSRLSFLWRATPRRPAPPHYTTVHSQAGAQWSILYLSVN